MTVSPTSSRHDQKVNVKVVLSGLWVSMLFDFAYVDIFGSVVEVLLLLTVAAVARSWPSVPAGAEAAG